MSTGSGAAGASPKAARESLGHPVPAQREAVQGVQGLTDWASAALFFQKRLAEGAPAVRGGAVRIEDLHAELVRHNQIKDLKCP